MDFSDKELKVLLQALYRFRGEVSGASQSEQNQLVVVNSVIDRIEEQAGPIKTERTRFDREMEENLSILKTGRMGAAKAAVGRKLDSAAAAPKVNKASPRAAKAGPGAKPSDKKLGGRKPAAAKTTKSTRSK